MAQGPKTQVLLTLEKFVEVTLQVYNYISCITLHLIIEGFMLKLIIFLFI